MRRILWTLAPAILAAAAMLIAPVSAIAGPGLPEEEEKKPARRDDDDSSTTTTLLTPTPIAATGAIVRSEVSRLRTSEVTPKDALLYVLVPDSARLLEGYRASAIAKIVGQEALQGDIDAALDSFRKTARVTTRRGLPGFLQMAYAADVDYYSARGVFRKELAFIILPPRDGKMRYAMAATVGLSREPLNDVVDALMGEIQTQYPQFTSSQKKHKGEKIKSLESKNFRISFAYFENLFLIGTGKSTITDMMDAYVGGSTRRLSGDKDYRAAEAEIGQDASIFYRANVSALADSLKSLMVSAPDQAAYLSAVMPTGGTLWGAISFDGEAVRERFEVRRAKGTKASRSYVDALPVPPKTMGFFPVDTTVYVAVSADPSRDLQKAVEDADANPMLVAGLSTINQVLGAKLETEILPAFGGEMAVGLITPPGKAPELLLAMEIKRPEMLKRATDTIERFFSGEMTGTHFRDYTIRHVPRPKTINRPSLALSFFPDVAYVKAGDIFLISSTKRGIEKAIRQQKHRRASLIEKSDFTRCTAALRPRRTSLLYVDTGALLTLLTEQIPTHLGQSFPGPLSDQREAQIAAPHLFGFGTVADESPLTSIQESYGPLGPVTGGTLAMLAAMSQSESANRGKAGDKDKENLIQIGVALQLYATDFDRFPLALSELYAPEYLPSLKAFEAPSGKSAVKTKDDIDARSDYVYVSGLTPVSLSDSIIVYDKPYVLGSGERNVLFINGTVEKIPEATFRLWMKAQGSEVKE